MQDILSDRLALLPSCPGVYLFRDSRGRVIYVGKATNLRSRVRAHFGSSADLSPKEQRMQQQVVSIETIVTDSEQQALLLECTLIKRHHPRYNVSLRDDKNFPYLRIDLREPWPRIVVTRRWQDDGARYFGPFASAGSVRETLALLKRLFPFRSCRKEITGQSVRPCLEYHIGRCLGPCVGKVSPEDYRKVIEHVVDFLEGRRDAVLKDLVRKMAEASEKLEFEKAAWFRDRIRSIELVVEGQQLAMAVRGDFDAIAMAHEGSVADVQVFFIRNSRFVGREHFTVDGTEGEPISRVMTSFVKQYYSSAPAVPPLILLQYPIEDERLIAEWLKLKRGGPVRIQVAKRGARRDLIEVVADNARQALEALRLRHVSDEELRTALVELQSTLSLSALPQRIECYDVSNIQGMVAVGSMVVFEAGRPKPEHYRRFRIKTLEKPDDYAMLGEVLGRRLQKVFMGEGDWAELPDLILVDGGKGQLNAVLEVIERLNLRIPVAALAKQKEEIFVPGASEPLVLPLNSPALRLLQRIRDEAHRFAITYHRNLRKKRNLASILDGVPGIGPKRRGALLRKFGSVSGIRMATVNELMSVAGISRNLAERLKRYLSDNA